MRRPWQTVRAACRRTRAGRDRPLHIAWDTNLLIDYFDHGLDLWRSEAMPTLVPSARHGEELETMQLIVALWVLRDIRFHVLRGSVDDAKHGHLSEERRRQRHAAWLDFRWAIAMVQAGEPARYEPNVLPRASLERALAQVPEGNDRELVREAVAHNLDVFLTRDRKVIRARPALRRFGLLITSPGELLEDLVACGAFHCLFASRYAYWPLPDQTRVAHLMNALSR